MYADNTVAQPNIVAIPPYRGRTNNTATLPSHHFGIPQSRRLEFVGVSPSDVPIQQPDGLISHILKLNDVGLNVHAETIAVSFCAGQLGDPRNHADREAQG